MRPPLPEAKGLPTVEEVSLFSPYRLAAPPEPEGPDAADLYEVHLRARTLRARRLVYGACGVVAMLFAITYAEKSRRAELTVEEMRAAREMRAADRIEDAHARVAAAVAIAADEQLQFEQAIGDAIDDDLAPSDAQIACPISLQSSPTLLRVKRLPLLIVDSEDRDLPSPSIGRLRSDIQRVLDLFVRGRVAEGVAYSNGLVDVSSRLRFDVVFATTTMTHPARSTETSFDPGEAIGRAYVYDFSEHRVVCAGDVHAKSSKNISYSWEPAPNGAAARDQGPSLSASLDDDFDQQVEREITSSLFAIDD